MIPWYRDASVYDYQHPAVGGGLPGPHAARGALAANPLWRRSSERRSRSCSGVLCQRTRRPARQDPVDALIGCAPFKPADEALNHDHYLYGWPKEEEPVKLLADTGALLALFDPRDKLHRRARQFAHAAAGTRFVLTELILSETVTRLRARPDAGRAADVGAALLSSRRYEVIFVDPPLIEAGLGELRRFADKRSA